MARRILGGRSAGLALCVLAPFLSSRLPAGAEPSETKTIVLSLAAGLTPAPAEGGSGLFANAGGWLDEGRSAAFGSNELSARLLEGLGYSAANLGAVDLDAGAEAIRALAAASKAAVLSANVFASGSKERLARPHVVVKVPGAAIGVVGVTAPPRRMPPGLEVRNAEDALAEVLPGLAKECDAIVVLAWMDRTAAASILRRFPAVRACVAAGSGIVDPEPLQLEESVLLQAPKAMVARVSFELDARGALANLRQENLPAPSTLPEELGELVASAWKKERVFEKLLAAETEGKPAPPLALSPEPGSRVRLGLSGENRAVRLMVHAVRVAAEYGGIGCPEGRVLLVADLEWENIIPLTLVRERRLPTEYRVPVLGDHLYLVLDRREVARLSAGEEPPPGYLPVADFKLERIGSRLRGNVCFDAPARSPRVLELRFYDYAHGHISIPLLGPAQVEKEPPASIVASGKNELIEAAILAVEKSGELRGLAAGKERIFVKLDFRARSLFTFQVDASIFDPKAAKGAKAAIGTVADWKDAWKYLQLVVDGEYGYAPHALTTFPAEPRFLPDQPTGGDVVFLAPEAFRSLELRCDFPNARTPDGGKELRPTGIRLNIEGTRPKLPDRKPLASVVDDNFRVAVTSQEARPDFAGEHAGEGSRFLVLDLAVANEGPRGEFFQAPEQLKYAAEDGGQIEIDAASARGAHPPAELLWIPAGERRAFQAVFRIDARETRPRLAYAGVSLADVLQLKALEAPAVVGIEAEPPRAPAAEEMTREEDVPAAAEAEPAEREKAPVAVEGEGEPPSAAEAEPPEREKAPVAAEGEEPAAAAKPPLVPKGLAGVGLTDEAVNQAIDRGAAFLWNYVKEKECAKGRYKRGDYETHILVSLALVHAGADEKFPDFKRELEGYFPRIDVKKMGTYEVGILGMLIDACGDPAYIPVLGQAIRYLLEGQGVKGSWDYSARFPENVLKDPASDRAIRVSGGIPLDGSAESDRGMARITGWENGSDGDNSLSQYAVLGLHAAANMGLKLDAEVWRRSVSVYSERQCKDGGWGYTTGSSYGSMSCAGICSLAIGMNALGEQGGMQDHRIRRGLDWLAANFSVTTHPGSQSWFYYYLYSLERVGRILNIDFVGENEWYPLGARYLLSAQKPDGSWVGSSDEKDPRLATSFALLFLTRATRALRGELQRGGEGTLKTAIALSRQPRFYCILDASGSMLDEMEGRQKFDIARDAVAALVEEMPEDSTVALRVYGHRKRSIEAGAGEDTELLIPMGPLDRPALIAKLKTLRARGKTPLALSLEKAAQDLAKVREDQPIVAVLLTDGGEDTFPRRDPVKAAEELGKVKNVTLHVVGFDIGREDWSRELEGICAKARGKYWPAGDASALLRELRAAVLGLPEGFEVFDTAGRAAARGVFGEAKVLPEGKYRLRAPVFTQVFEEDFWINTEAVTHVTFNADAVVNLKAVASTAAPPEAKAAAATEARTEDKAPERPAAGFCTECGNPLKPGDRFCRSCGKQVRP